jgi:N-acetylglucosaminyl-diphospho-decaprenol L-rhamnosyltransferase
MDVSVVIVTYNSASSIADCLTSVQEQREVQRETIVIDNASSDATLSVVRGSSANPMLIENRENVGFGRACNQGFAASKGRYVYLLNPDAQLIGSNVLSTLCQALSENKRWGMAGSRVISATGEWKAPATTYPDQSHVRKDFSRLPGNIAWVVGASMIVRREVYSELGGFDPEFFLYSEETDFCLRLRERGYEIGLVDEAAVRHIGGASESGRDPYDVWTRRSKGLHLFWRKHYPRADVTKLLRRNRLRARYRMLVNGWLARFQPPKSSAWQKYRRYRAVWETCSKSLLITPTRSDRK